MKTKSNKGYPDQGSLYFLLLTQMLEKSCGSGDCLFLFCNNRKFQTNATDVTHASNAQIASNVLKTSNAISVKIPIYHKNVKMRKL